MQGIKLSKSQRGVSLIQTLVSMSILVVLVSLSAPNMSAVMTRTSISATQQLLMQNIREARAAAKSSRSVAYICPSNDGSTCLKVKHWHQGWISYLDLDLNLNKKSDAGDVLITTYQPADDDLTINVSLNAAGRAKAIKIDKYGTLRTSGNLRICDKNNDRQHIDTIKMSNKGRLAIELRDIPCA